MPTLDPHEHPLMTLLAPVFAALEEDGEIDLVALPGNRGFEIQADDWTIHLADWPITMGFIALDEEPATPGDYPIALAVAVDPTHIAALRHANTLLDGSIVDALDASGDNLSRLLAATLISAPDAIDDGPIDA